MRSVGRRRLICDFAAGLFASATGCAGNSALTGLDLLVELRDRALANTAKVERLTELVGPVDSDEQDDYSVPTVTDGTSFSSASIEIVHGEVVGVSVGLRSTLVASWDRIETAFGTHEDLGPTSIGLFTPKRTTGLRSGGVDEFRFRYGPTLMSVAGFVFLNIDYQTEKERRDGLPAHIVGMGCHRKRSSK
jgi:hypothetical protein